jgi:GTP-binding protein EngB required for normal cell division
MSTNINSSTSQEITHNDSTDNSIELLANDQARFENQTPETSNDPTDFGSIDDNVPPPIRNFPEVEFTLEKHINSCCNYHTRDRRVIITTHPENGREIRIYSKNGEDILDKNTIPFTYTNPIVNIDGNSIDLQRRNGSIVTLKSSNQALIKLFQLEITSHRTRIIELNHIFWKWTYCFQSAVIRFIQSASNTQQHTREAQSRTLHYERHIKTMSKHFITTALRYLTNHLQHSSHGYTYLLKFFFDKWYKEYNRNCIKESIKKNHENVQRITNLFSVPAAKSINGTVPFTIPKKISQTTKISNHVNSINKELKQIVSNLQSITYCTNDNMISEYSDNEKITVVKNLQHLAELRHHLQTMNNEEEEFILVGDQSSGKSSLLCMLLGVNIGYTSEHFATRCPVRYQLEPCAPSHGWNYQFENPQTKEFENVTQEELQKKLTTHFEKVIGRQIVYNPITIKIYSPVCTSSMTLVDLPGLVGKGTDKIKQQQHSKSYHIVQEYLKKQNNIVLFVQRVDLDVGSLNTTILDEVQKRTPDKVVYCLTHFDRLCSDRDVRLEEIMRIITYAQKEIACNKDMFLLSLSKRVEDLYEKEQMTHDIINRLRAEFPDRFRRNTIHFNIQGLKKFLRKNIHKHVNQIEGVVYQFIHQQREHLIEHSHYINRSLVEPIINDVVLEQFIELFKKKTIKLLKGQFLPDRIGPEQTFFESLSTEVANANKYAVQNNTPIWPPQDMKQRELKTNPGNLPNNINTNLDNLDSASSYVDNQEDNPILVFENSPKSVVDDSESVVSANTSIAESASSNTSNQTLHTTRTTNTIQLSIIPEHEELNPDVYDSYFGDNMDSSLQRDLVSHALFTRTIYELQLRLWSVFLSPRYQDIIYAIATDPNINLDGPKDAIYCVMTHTIRQQLSMNNFFSYALKRLEYILFKIIRYVIWVIQHSPETPQECIILLSRPEFQAILEIEIYNYCTRLSKNTYQELTNVFDEIMSAPIVVSHALRYKEMLIKNFGWSEEEIDACTLDDIFKPRSINVEKDIKQDNEQEEQIRTERIKNLITLHIHVRLIMITEHMVRAIDFNWRRMLDDSQESTFTETQPTLFTHIKQHVLRSVNVNGSFYSGEYLYKLYSGDEQTKLEDEKQCVEDVLTALDDIVETTELLPNLMTESMKIAGDKFL